MTSCYPRAACKPTLSWRAKLGLLALNLGLCLAPAPALSAERILLNISVLEFSLSVESLETFAEEGKVEGNLELFADFLTPQQLEEFQTLLTTSADLSPVAVAQFLYSPQGELILEQAGELIKTQAGQSGFYALRAAFIKAAADEEGLTPLNVIKQFPVEGIRINSARGFEIINQLNSVIQQTQQVTTLVQQQFLSEITAAVPVAEFSELENLTESGPVPFRQETFQINDDRRNRSFPVDLYFPQTPGQASLIVISHGLGSDRSTFAYLARHLASYGFAVAVPEHPGSNAEQIGALIRGVAQQVTPPRELVDRPLDISFLLDVLEDSIYAPQIRLQDVGVLGQSFGAYTALALAGADINFENLTQECQQFQSSFNISFLLQCEALKLPPVNYNLQDSRVGGVIAINPLTSAIFGKSELADIDIPVMLISGSADTVTPALQEQIIPFTWLDVPEKYLVLIEGATHFSTLAEDAGSVPIPAAVLGTEGETAQQYVEVLATAFFKTYVAENLQYLPYLSSPYIQVLSQEELPLFLVESLALDGLQGQ
jgi:predicted dienelactone hydrolase